MGKIVQVEMMDAAVLYACIHFERLYADALRDQYPSLSPREISRMVGSPTVGKLGGYDSEKVKVGERSLGVVNRLLLRAGIDQLLTYGKQYYRINDEMAEAGLMLPGDGSAEKFVVTDAGERLVRTFLKGDNPNHWPTPLFVQDGRTIRAQSLVSSLQT